MFFLFSVRFHFPVGHSARWTRLVRRCCLKKKKWPNVEKNLRIVRSCESFFHFKDVKASASVELAWAVGPHACRSNVVIPQIQNCSNLDRANRSSLFLFYPYYLFGDYKPKRKASRHLVGKEQPVNRNKIKFIRFREYRDIKNINIYSIFI